MNNETTLILCGLAGVLFHCLLKLQGLLTDARVANVEFKPIRDYWLRDAVGICLSLLSVGIWYLVYKEVQNKYVAVSDWNRISFVGMGLLGSYVIQLISSRAKRRIRQIVDTKTNELEGEGTKTPLAKPKTIQNAPQEKHPHRGGIHLVRGFPVADGHEGYQYPR